MAVLASLRYWKIDEKIQLALDETHSKIASLFICHWPRTYEVQGKAYHFSGQAEAVTDPLQIADFLEPRLQPHPRMIGLMMKMHNLPFHPNRDKLEDLAKSLAMVVIHSIAII